MLLVNKELLKQNIKDSKVAESIIKLLENNNNVFAQYIYEKLITKEYNGGAHANVIRVLTQLNEEEGVGGFLMLDDEKYDYDVTFEYLSKESIYYIEDIIQDIEEQEPDYKSFNKSTLKKLKSYVSSDKWSLALIDLKTGEIKKLFEFLDDAFDYVFKRNYKKMIDKMIFKEY